MKEFANRPGHEAHDFLRLGALVLFLIFACNWLTALLPLALLNPAWQLGAIQSLHGLAFLPLIGTCLLLLDPKSEASSVRQQLGWIRRGCLMACLGFLFLMPLQASALWRLGTLVEVPANRTIATIAGARSEISSSNTLTELNAALSKLPGAPKLPPGFNQPLALVRQNMQQKLDADLKKLRTDQRMRINYRRLSDLMLLGKAVILDLAFAVFFGALAGLKAPRLPTKLGLLNPFKLLANSIESWDRAWASRRRAAEIARRPGPIELALKSLNKQLKYIQRQGNARRLAARTEGSRRSRR